jgi:hypothetical protein
MAVIARIDERLEFAGYHTITTAPGDPPPARGSAVRRTASRSRPQSTPPPAFPLMAAARPLAPANPSDIIPNSTLTSSCASAEASAEAFQGGRLRNRPCPKLGA